MEERVSEMEKLYASLESRIDNIQASCPIDAYKNEMKERCKRFSDNIANNKEDIAALKTTLEREIVDSERRCNEKTKYNRLIIGRVISGLLMLGVALGSILGTIQINKIGRAEFVQHIDHYKEIQETSATRFDSFMSTYRSDRDKRDAKIDRVFEQQIIFNQSMIRNTGLLQQQLEVVKTKLGVK